MISLTIEALRISFQFSDLVTMGNWQSVAFSIYLHGGWGIYRDPLSCWRFARWNCRGVVVVSRKGGHQKAGSGLNQYHRKFSIFHNTILIYTPGFSEKLAIPNFEACKNISFPIQPFFGPMFTWEDWHQLHPRPNLKTVKAAQQRFVIASQLFHVLGLLLTTYQCHGKSPMKKRKWCEMRK